MSDAIANALNADTPPAVAPFVPGMNRPYPPEKSGATGPQRPPDLKTIEKLVRGQKRFDAAIRAESSNRQKAVICLRFKGNDQWEPELAAERASARRPRLTVNKIVTFVNQVVNDQRQNRPGINISPVGAKSDVELAQMYRGLIKAIERDSDAELAYDTAFESAVDIGWGFWRYDVQYAEIGSFRRKIVIQPINDTMAVYLDPDAQLPEGSDAKWCFITEWMTRDDFKRQYPGVPVTNWEQGAEGDRYRNWADDQHVRVAEYFETEIDKRTLVMLANGHVGFEDELPADVVARSQAGAERFQVIDEREVECPRVTWCKMVANCIIPGTEQEWIGSSIPIVRTIYERVMLNGKAKWSGIIERMLDPQRMYNYWVSQETETLALAPKAPWQIAEGQDAGYEDEYATANQVPNPVVHYRPVSLGGHPVPPPQRLVSQTQTQGFIAAKQGAQQDMMAVSGIRFDATPQERLYDESGKALREINRIGDLGTFHGIDNLSRAMRRGGEILLELIPKIYDEAQIVTILGEDEKEQMVRIDPTAPQAVGQMPMGQGQKVMRIFNPNVGKYSVTVTIGPNFKTQREEAVDGMLRFLEVVPQAAPLIMDVIARNMPWPQAQEIAARLAKGVPPNVLTPEPKDMSPQVAALVQNLQTALQQAAQEKQQLIKMLSDKDADRALLADKYEKDFEAKVLAIVQKTEMAAQHANANAGSQIKDLVQATKMIDEGLNSNREAA